MEEALADPRARQTPRRGRAARRARGHVTVAPRGRERAATGSMADVSARISALSPSKRALLLERLGAREAARAPAGEPVAVLGMGCRFPGARDPEAFFRLLLRRTDAIREVPPDRWDAARLVDPDPAARGSAGA